MGDIFTKGFGFREKKDTRSLAYKQKNFYLKINDGSSFIIVLDWPPMHWDGFKVRIWNKFEQDYSKIIIPDDGNCVLGKYSKYGFKKTEHNTISVLNFPINSDDDSFFDEEEDDIVEFLKGRKVYKNLYHILANNYPLWSGMISKIQKKKKNNAIVNRVFNVTRCVEKSKKGEQKNNTPVAGNMLTSIKLISDEEVREIANVCIDSFMSNTDFEMTSEELEEYKRNFVLPFNYSKAIKSFTKEQLLSGLHDGSIKQNWKNEEQTIPFDDEDMQIIKGGSPVFNKVEETKEPDGVENPDLELEEDELPF